jgi:hypothetical protein
MCWTISTRSRLRSIPSRKAPTPKADKEAHTFTARALRVSCRPRSLELTSAQCCSASTR